MWYSGLINFVYFAFSVLLVAVLIIFILGTLFSSLARAKEEISGLAKGRLEINKLGDKYNDTKDYLLYELMTKKEYKKHNKALKKNKVNNEPTKNVFVLSFEGDMNASQVENLREEVTAVLSVAKNTDEVIVRIDSPGGVVNGYGFAASQLERIRQSDINLTVCIDQIAASGGYMMSAVAHQIISSPFAIVGSIGVVGTVPNIRELLKKNGVDVEMHTSGQYKRTLTTTGKNTREGRDKFKEDLQNIHELFKNHILTYRPNLDIDKVATGEYWFGKDALKLGLVDKIQTFDDYIVEYFKNSTSVYEVNFVVKQDKGFLKSKLIALQKIATNLIYNRKIM